MGLTAEHLPLNDDFLEPAILECLLELVHSGSIREPLAGLCDALQTGLNAESCEILFAGAGNAGPVIVAMSDKATSSSPPLDPEKWRALARLGDGMQAADSPRSLLFPMRHGNSLVAALHLHWRNAEAIPLVSLDSVSNATPLLTRIMVNAQLAQQQKRHDLYEERATISRELHDSLAQSLTYLKIQASRLDQALNPKDRESVTQEGATEILEELKTTLSDAYRQLRELMTTFRLTMHGKSFRHAVRDSVEEFTNRSNIAFELNNAWNDEALSVDEEIQVLQIIREALYNIVRHSRADHARISLAFRVNSYRLRISDNGIGLNPERRKLRHHGLVIMQERTRRLDGNMRISTPKDGGTLIEIHFIPRGLRQ